MKFKRINMIDFGKHKGKSFEYVLNELEDYSYLVWMDAWVNRYLIQEKTN